MGLRCINVLIKCCEKGVFAHASIIRQARQLGLSGSIMGFEGQMVRVEAEGPEQVLKQFLGLLQSFSISSDDYGLLVRWMSYQGKYSDFQWIRNSVDSQDE